MVEVVVVGHGPNVVEVLEVVGPVPVVGGVMVFNVVVFWTSVVVVPGPTVVVVAAVVDVVPGGGARRHPNELATDANSGPAPGKLLNAA